MYIPYISRVFRYIKLYPFLVVFLLGSLWGILYLILPVDYQRDILAPTGEEDRVYFGDGVVLSQEFIPHRGLSGIDIPLGSDAYPNTPLILHIRSTREGKDIVNQPLFSFHDSLAQFHFSPLWKVPDKLVWILEAPHASEDSFWLYREHDTSAFREGLAYQNKKYIKGNLGFTERWIYPRMISLTNANRDSNSVYEFADWEYISLLMGVIGVLVFFLLRRFPIQEKTIVVGVIVGGVLLRVWLAGSTPVIIDEGSYIQDVLQSSGDLLQFRDFLTKGPLYLFLLWVWSFIVPNTIIAWRLFSILMWAMAGWWFWRLAYELEFRKRSRLFAAGSFALLPSAVGLTTPLLLQTVSVAVAVLGLLIAVRAAKRNSWQLAYWAGTVFASAFFIRVTAVIPAVITIGILYLFAKRGTKIKLITAYILTGVILFGLVFGTAIFTIGLKKAAVFVNMEALVISQNRQELAQAAPQQQESLIRELTIESRLFWRSGSVLVVSLLFFPLMLLSRKRVFRTFLLSILLFYLSWEVLANLIDTDFLLPKKHITTVWTILTLCTTVPLITAITQLLYGSRDTVKIYWSRLQTPLIIIVWLTLTIFAYSRWGRFRQNYLTEFLPQLILIFAVSADYVLDLWRKIRPQWLSSIVIGMLVYVVSVSLYQGYVMSFLYPHTGTIDQKSLVKTVRLIREHVPAKEVLFTAQPVVSALSDRQIIFGYSHPGWYREARFGTISEELRDLLFKRPEEITEYLSEKARFVLMDTRTNEIYFDGYPERGLLLEQKFEPIGSVPSESGDASYTLYRKR